MPEPKVKDESERGERSRFDRRSGEVHGSGSGAGGSGNPAEDYDQDSKGGSGATPNFNVAKGRERAPGERK